jgi:hypothetical protein
VLRAAVAAERVGVPSVSLVCEGFERQAVATGRGLGFDNMRVAVLRGHVDSQARAEMIASFLAHTVPQVIAGLTQPDETDAGEADGEPSALDIVATGTLDEINEFFITRGWSDGSPFLPPTRERVEAFIAPTGHDPWRQLGVARPSGRDITVWSVAVNAVMAGCHPAHLPVLLAAAETIAGNDYGVEHSGNTTGADALMVLNGPCITDLGFNHGQGVLREGTRANTSVGRWLRLFQRNVCGFTADEHDKGTFGNSTRTVLAEDHEALREIGWSPVSGDFGFDHGDDVLTMVRINAGMMVGSVFGSTPEEILPYLADALVRVTGWELTHNFGLGRAQYRPLLILSPVLARIFGRAGWSKDDVRNALFDMARLPASKYEQLIGEWSNLTAGRRTLTDLVAKGELPDVFAESDDPQRLVPIVTAPDKFVIAVSGDPNRTNAYVMSNDGSHGQWTANAIDRSFATDLMCRIDNPAACAAG